MSTLGFPTLSKASLEYSLFTNDDLFTLTEPATLSLLAGEAIENCGQFTTNNNTTTTKNKGQRVRRSNWLPTSGASLDHQLRDASVPLSAAAFLVL